MMANWEKLCELMTNGEVFGKREHRFDKEKDFEYHFAEYLFTIFGWSSQEIKRQMRLQIGNGNEIIPDIVLVNKGNKPLVVIELKHYMVSNDLRELEEIKSQIKQASTAFGIFSNGVTVHLFYRSSYSEPEEIFCAPFSDRNNKYAQKLCDVLDRCNFSIEKMTDLCEEIKATAKIEHSDNPNLFMISSQMTKELDKKIHRMIREYVQWLETNPKEKEAATSFANNQKWIKENIFNTDKLKSLSSKEYSELIHEIHKHTLAINGAGMLQIYGEFHKKPVRGWGLIGDRKRLIKGIEKLKHSTKDEASSLLRQFTNKDSEYKIKGVGPMFWSEMIRCRFDNIPLQNEKTKNFFKAIGVEIGFQPEQKIQNISYCYDRWKKQWNETEQGGQEVDIPMLSHMEHFAFRSEEGRRFLAEEFDYKSDEA